jgi:UDP-glucose:(heptosyl)LPS alpha-1,3-glucosyltransferase
VSSRLRVTQVVRQFGRVGGMESYVFELTNSLVRQGVDVCVICEAVHDELSGVTIFQVAGPGFQRPRWRAMQHFRDQVSRLVESEKTGRFGIIHSHERTRVHQVTTFHGPPINLGIARWLPMWLFPRVWAWVDFEKVELYGDQVSAVIPVSQLIGNILESRYPGVLHKIPLIGWPAPKQSAPTNPMRLERQNSPITIGFVGREWRRKGLAKASAICRRLIDRGFQAQLLVIGAEQLPRGFGNDGMFELIEWSDNVPYGRMDILLHPASIEPYGMVIAEARAAGVPVVCSDQTGAKDHGFSDLTVLPLQASLDEWSDAICMQLERQSEPEVLQTWDGLARAMITTVYRPIWESDHG